MPDVPNKWDGGDAEGRAILDANRDAAPGLAPTAHALAVLDDLEREAEAGGETELAAKIRAVKADPAKLRAFRVTEPWPLGPPLSTPLDDLRALQRRLNRYGTDIVQSMIDQIIAHNFPGQTPPTVTIGTPIPPPAEPPA